MAMSIQINQPSDVGRVIRAVRSTLDLRQDDTAHLSGVSEGFMLKLESGNPSVNMGKVMEVLASLGIKIELTLPPGASMDEVMAKLTAKPAVKGKQ